MLHHDHGGDIYRNHILYDFSININPLGLPEGVKRALIQTMDQLDSYPDAQCEALRNELGAFYNIHPEWIVCGNGAADLIYLLVQYLRPKRAVVMSPTFSEYEMALGSVGCITSHCPLERQQGFQVNMDVFLSKITPEIDVVFFCNPNNPTGIPVKKEEIERLASVCEKQGAFLILDECFCELSDQSETVSFLSGLRTYKNLMILRAFTKTYAMAGLRLGYGMCSETRIVKGLEQLRQPWSVSTPAQVAGVAALSERAYVEQAKEIIRVGRAYLKNQLEHLGFEVYESQVNYLLFYDRENLAGGRLWELCIARGILIRDCKNLKGLGMGDYRVCVRTMKENKILVETLGAIIKDTKGEERG